MNFQTTIYIECPSCRTPIHLNSKCNSCYVCGRFFNTLENSNLKPKNP